MPNLSKKISGVLTADVFAFGLSVITGIILARGLDPSDRGKFGLCFSAIMLLGAIFTGGLNSAITYFVARRKYSTGQIVVVSFLWIMTSSLLIVSFLYYGVDFFNQNILKGLSSELVVLVAIMTPTLIANNLVIAILLGQGEYFGRNITQILRQFLRIILVSIALFVFSGHAYAAVLASFIALAGATLLAWWFVFKKVDLSFGLDKLMLRDIGIYSLRIYPAAVAGLVFGHISIFFLNALGVPLDEVGEYSVAVSTLLPVILFIPNAVSNVVFPEFTRITSEQRYNVAPLIYRCVFLITATICLILGVVAKPLVILLFGTEYAATAVIFIWLLPGVVMRTFGNISSQILNSSGNPHYTSIVSVSTLITVTLLNLLLIPAFGAKGAAGAYSLAFAYNSFVAILLCHKARVFKVSRIFAFGLKDIRLILCAATKLLSDIKSLLAS